jgi:hypothetical protein
VGLYQKERVNIPAEADAWISHLPGDCILNLAGDDSSSQRSQHGEWKECRPQIEKGHIGVGDILRERERRFALLAV